MTAQDIIDQIKVLPPEERDRVFDFVHTFETTSSTPVGEQQMDRARLDAISEKVFDRHDKLFRKLAQ